MKIFEKYYEFLREYCKNKPLNYDEIISYPRCGNEQILNFVKYDEEKGKNGLLDETPAEIILTIYYNEDGSFTISEGKNAKKYIYDN